MAACSLRKPPPTMPLVAGRKILGLGEALLRRSELERLGLSEELFSSHDERERERVLSEKNFEFFRGAAEPCNVGRVLLR